ncbi:MAG: hypothetical protein KBC43_04980 [Bacteroidales bacterium]|nr:hypothetical protein [Bacteroidales bacterium]
MKTPSNKTKSVSVLAIVILLIASSTGFSQYPTVTVRFNNPEYVCATQTYSLDVEMQCDSANKRLHGMNVRFFYDDDVLEFTSFTEIIAAYGLTIPNPPEITTDSTGLSMELFGIEGNYEYVNGAIKVVSSTPVTYLPTNGWTKIFAVNFHVDDPEVFQDSTFCPAVIWDLQEDPSLGGMIGGGGVCITLVKVYPNITSPATEHVNQFNWQYDYIPGLPYGLPAETNCISTLSSYAPKSIIPWVGMDAPGTFSCPVRVVDFLNIKSFSLIFRYDPLVMTYISNSPNPVFNATNGYLTVTDASAAGGLRRITMTFNGLNSISLPDNSILCGFQFNYIGGEAAIGWRTNSSGCTYYGPGGILKCDQPYSNYFIDGGIVSMLAPVTKVDSAALSPGEFGTFAVRVWDFQDIRAGILTLGYNPATLIYQETIPNPALGEEFEANLVNPGLLQFSWSAADTTLADSSIIVHLTFQYLGGNSTLYWINDGTSCQYFHSNIPSPMTDIPTSSYYFNGNVENAVYIWSGDNSSEWGSDGNWENGEAPNQNMDVIVDPTVNPDNWPVFDGDFTLGEHCRNLIINGNAQLIINGNLNVLPGRALSLTGNGILKVDGNWTNSGIFYPGDGTIEFTGTTNAVIAAGDPPGNYVSNYSLTPFSSTYIPLSGGLPGPAGNDSHSDVPIGFPFTYLGVSYSMARINTNGWLSLNLSGEDTGSGNNLALFETAGASTALAPWWDDLSADAGASVTYLTEGIAPFRVFTTEWYNVLSYSTGSASRLNFQVKLYETLNIIEFYYGTAISGYNSPDEGASIGIKDAMGGQGHYIEATQNSTDIILAFLNSSADWPAQNFRFIPPLTTDMEIFHKIIVNKPGANLSIQKDIKITGLE